MKKSNFQIIRESELEAALAHFPPGCRVLELGGGTGWQAQLLSERGFLVSSVDVELHAPADTFFPVQLYDGVHLPFGDDSFDVVFSSNVMEHVQDRGGLLKEVSRVCVQGGVALHILPNPWWRLATLLGFYPYKAKRVLAQLLSKSSSSDTRGVPSHAYLGEKPFRHKFLYDAPHGEFSSALAELWYFSAFFWRKELAQSGMTLVDVRMVGGYAYQGYSDLNTASLACRAAWPRALGRPCTMYVLRKN